MRLIKLRERFSQALNYVRYRKKLLILTIVFGSLGAVPAFALGGNQLVEAVDSSAFCTDICHDVHKAEAITYEVSPHSEVSCSKCHVGEGSSNLILSKLNGLKDIVPAITHSYETPLPTPLESMRPSSQTCETCHWSAKFSGDMPAIKTTYKADEANTKNTLALVLKVGGGSREVAAGIHWHTTARIWYLPADEQRRQIAWVAVEDASGDITEYVDPVRIAEITPELIQEKKRQMDCVDCHNRVSHLFRSPDELIDEAISDGGIDIQLPFIKQQGVKALVPQNASLAEAYTRVEAIHNFYKTNYPEILSSKSDSLDKAITKLKDIARLTTFDDGLDWNTHLDNSVHIKPDENMLIDWQTVAKNDDSAGCFRCHGNLLKLDDAGVISLEQALNELGNGQITQKVAQALEEASKSPPVMTVAEITDYLKNVNAFGDNRTDTFTAENLTDILPAGAYPKETVLGAECSSCHYTLKSPFISPIAPAVPHPVDGLDDCLTCHNPEAAAPFKSTHPWTVNEACGSCHQSAPKLKPLPISTAPEDAKPIPHDNNGLESCTVCHSPSGAQPLKSDHPWATDKTCTACHQTAAVLKAMPLSAPPPSAPEISHPTESLQDCLSCHGQPTVMPFSTNHAWSTNDSCAACHKQSSNPISVSHQTTVMGPKIAHTLSGLSQCVACHTPKSGHPWTNASSCTMCHEAPSVGAGGGALGGAAGGALGSTPQITMGPNILHSITGLESCTACHNIGGAALFPTSHAGRTNGMCLICHVPATASSVPSAPSALTAAPASAGQVNLSWTDGSNDETGFRLQRATNSSFTSGLVTMNCPANTVNYSDTTTSGSTTYYYRIGAYNMAGDSTLSNITSVTTPAATGTPPAAPSGLAAAAVSATQINLSWIDNSSTETGFRIDRATSSNFQTNMVSINTGVNAASYSDTTVSGGTTYYYRLVAFNAAGNSAVSASASATTPAVTVDAAALYSTQCAACHGANRQGASASALTASALSARTVAQVTATITNGTSGMPGYSSSLSSAQISALSQWLKGNPPATPSSLAATTINAGQINLTWVDNSNDETIFRIERATDTGFSANLVTVNTAANAVSYSDTTVSGSTTYYYRIIAVNGSGNSAASNTASATTPAAAVSAPAAPGVLAGTAASSTQINLTWQDNSTTETGVRLDRATNSAFSANLVTVNLAANAVSYSDTTVSGSITYYYRAYAFNSGGNSAASNTCSVNTPTPPIDPAAIYSSNCAACHGANRQGASASALTASALSARTVAQVTATITNGTSGMPGYSSSLSSAQISALSQWLKGNPPATPSSLAATTINAGQINLTWVDNSNDETIFRIERATDTGFSANLVTVNTAANAVSYSDTTVSGSTTYYYRIIAVNGSGNSAASNTASATTPAATGTLPAAPSGLATSAVSSTQVNLTWQDNAANENGFRIDRATNNTFSANLVTVSTAANAVSYSDTTVSGSTTYYYRVVAVNASGDSAASNTASATTPAAPPPPSPAPAITHTITGYTTCLACHATNLGIRPVPSSHSGRTEDTCLTCHASSADTSTPFLSNRKRIESHSLDAAHTNCTSCHRQGGSAPWPGGHSGRTSITCLVCHRP